jgi:transposase
VEYPVEESSLSVSERVRLRELEDEVRELRMKSDFLGTTTFFTLEYR